MVSIMKTPAFITVRTSSTRLPKKCLLPFGDGNVLEHIIRRAKHYHLDVIVCTSVDRSDDVIQLIAEKEDVKCFRGSILNKLKRWRDCCDHFNIEKFHTVDADDPFFDGELMKMSFALLKKGYDMVCPTKSSSAGAASVGYSLTKEIIDAACALISENEDTEMMWYYVDKIKGLKKIILPEQRAKQIKMRLTLDYEEDYWLLQTVRRILGNLASTKDINDLFLRNSELYKVNWFRNEEWKRGQLSKKI
jgi:spore coat polysaccharide biosynthesis protein SpsF